MKIALLNDTHFGCRNDNPAFMKHQNKFYDEVFFPYMIQHNIKSLIHLGDVVDRRKFINHNTAHNFKKNFWNRLENLDIDTHIIIGNHDTYFKNTNEINAMENLSLNRNSIVYTKTQEVTFDGLNILFVPWICDDNEEDSLYQIDNSTAEICMGHLEVKGFEMHKGHINEHGYEKNIFKRFEKVLSGHFHKKSTDGQIFYLGTQYEMTWSDYHCPKGFHIFDTSTRELERVRNPLQIFRKINYDDTKEDYNKKDLSKYEDCFVKLFVINRTDEDMFNNLIDRLQNKINVHEVNIIEDGGSDITETVKENILEQGEDTMTFLHNYIEQINTDLDKPKLKKFVSEVYNEASDT